ncbi:MAG TPA: HPF/RaiA family ribosome-associated protein [Verrucomicrobiota bacterium]|jgi:ribosome-associated translation inhibitor RaiA|nr:HPF/RaiA family ribosome-associated protein [Verrucomicrobiota bacterium]HRT09101.1 HPF/RaiA family ribosome-associated protein [Candidatus Paceibacterota bacterium]HRT58411.1 HPF/RaiA family ribosome-associated protein [Candidatus Paceibacterota bacterium]
MKMTIEHAFVRSTHAVDSLIEERIFALQPRLEIEEARVRLEQSRESSPPFRVAVHLVTPGPDLKAEGRDHTLRAAIEKAVARLDALIVDKGIKRMRRLRSNRQAPASIRTGRGRSRR